MSMDACKESLILLSAITASHEQQAPSFFWIPAADTLNVQNYKNIFAATEFSNIGPRKFPSLPCTSGYVQDFIFAFCRQRDRRSADTRTSFSPGCADRTPTRQSTYARTPSTNRTWSEDILGTGHSSSAKSLWLSASIAAGWLRILIPALLF